jgi:hypothetical protein
MTCRACSRGLAGDLEVGRRFHVIMIKPSHYDDDGYVIQ